MVVTVPEIEVRPPACLWVPPGRVGSFVEDVATVAERISRPLEPEQWIAVDALTAHDERRRFLSIEAGAEMARQNGKTAAVGLPIALWTALTDPDHITWSAHMYETALKEFRALTDDDTGLIPNVDWLRRRVRTVSSKDGEEGITFTNGAQLDFRCRSGRRGRGLSGNTMFLDEWLYGKAAMIGAALPGLATRSQHGNARAYYLSSAAKQESAHLRSLRARALRADPSLTWVGWWAPGSFAEPGCAQDECTHVVGVEGCALDDERLWVAANPLLDRMTSRAFLRAMRNTMTPTEFAREFLGWEEGGDDAVDVSRWGALADPASVPLPRPVGLALDVAPGQKSAAIVAVGLRADGLAHVDVLAHRPGTDWVLDVLREKQASTGAVVHHLGGRQPVASLIEDQLAGHVRLQPVNEVEFSSACESASKRIDQSTIRHRGDVHLSTALAVAARRTIGDGWVMSRKSSAGDISPAIAFVLALRAMTTEQPVEIWGFIG